MNYFETVIKNIKKGPKGLIILLFFYFGIFIVVLTKTIEYFKEIINLLGNWELPDKIGIYESVILKIDDQHKVIVLASLLIATFFSYLFVLASILKLNRTTRLFSANDVFLSKVSNDFKVSSRFFLVFIIITIGINISIIILTNTIHEFTNSFSLFTLYKSNTSIYFVVYALMLFISDILGRGTLLNEEAEYTI